MAVKKMAVIGEGRMGSGIVQHIASCGIPVVMDGISDESVAKSLEGIKASYAKNVGKGRITQEQMDQAVSNISITSKIEDVADCDFIIECVYEDAELKTGIFAQLNELCPETTILPATLRRFPSALWLTAAAAPTGWWAPTFSTRPLS